MSYDLYLYPRKGKRMPTRERFFDHFNGEHFERNDDDEVHYSNPNTGVYFHFAYHEAGADSDNPNTGGRAHVYFNMNYFRPHYFGLEAETVLTPLVEAFKLTVDDPQADGMGQGDYSAEGFLRGWNSGNRFAAAAMRQLGGNTVGGLSLPMETNRRLWGWNFSREDLLETQHYVDLIDTYVPPIWLCQEAGQVKTFCLFPNLVPTTVPKVDYVMVTRDKLAGPYVKKSKKTPAWVTWDELRAAAPGFEVQEGDEDGEALDHLILYSEEYQSMETPPPALAKWVIGLPRWPGKPEQVRPDMVLDAELLAAGAAG